VQSAGGTGNDTQNAPLHDSAAATASSEASMEILKERGTLQASVNGGRAAASEAYPIASEPTDAVRARGGQTEEQCIDGAPNPIAVTAPAVVDLGEPRSPPAITSPAAEGSGLSGQSSPPSPFELGDEAPWMRSGKPTAKGGKPAGASPSTPDKMEV